MLPIGTRVRLTTGAHTDGTIVAYNDHRTDPYLMNNLNEVCDTAPPQLLGALANCFYDGDRYPYVILFDSGYQDVYSIREVEAISG